MFAVLDEDSLWTIFLNNGGIVQHILNKCCFSKSSALLDRLQRAHHITEQTRAGASSSCQYTVLISTDPVEIEDRHPISKVPCIVAKDRYLFGRFERKSAIDILQEDSALSGLFADCSSVVAAAVNIGNRPIRIIILILIRCSVG